MKTIKIIFILLIATSLFFAIESTIADDIQRSTEEILLDQDASIREKGPEEPFIFPDPSVVKQEYDGKIVGEDLSDDMPHILDVSNGDYDPNIALGLDGSQLESDQNNNENPIEIPIAIVVGLAAVLLIGFIFFKRR